MMEVKKKHLPSESIRRQRSDSFVHAYHQQVEQWQQRRPPSSSARCPIMTTPNTSPLLTASQYSDSDQEDILSLPSLRINTSATAGTKVVVAAEKGPLLEGVLIRRAIRPASHLASLQNHHKDDSSASSSSPRDDVSSPLSAVAMASPHDERPSPLLNQSPGPWLPPTTTQQNQSPSTPMGTEDPDAPPPSSLVSKLLSKREDSLFRRLTHRHPRLNSHNDAYSHDNMIYPPPQPLMDQDTELDQYGFQKATQWITLETCHEFERFYQPILDRRRARWQQLLDEHNGSLLDRCLQVRRYIRKGVPYQLRGQVWLHYSGAQSKMDANPGVYDKFLKRAQELGDTNEFADLIERDLHRTYPDNIQFSQTALAKTSGAASTTSPATPSPAKSANTTTTTTPPAIDVLRRVLCTFSVYCPSIGYCQSLNYLVGMLLLFMKEEEAFWCLVTTVHNILPAGVYDVTMEGTSIDQTVLMMLVHERMPQFWNKLTPKSFWEAEQDGVSMPTITLVTSHWFLTLFINILPTESVLRVWDCFFYEGSSVLFRIALTLFKRAEPIILTLEDPLEIFQVVQNFPRQVIDCHSLLDDAFRRYASLTDISNEDLTRRRELCMDVRKKRITVSPTDTTLPHRKLHDIPHGKKWRKHLHPSFSTSSLARK